MLFFGFFSAFLSFVRFEITAKQNKKNFFFLSRFRHKQKKNFELTSRIHFNSHPMPLVYVDHIDYTHVGFYYYVPGSPKRGAMPLDGVHVAVRVVDLVAEVQVMQFYVNNESRPVDAEYIFPLDEKAAVCGFEAELPHKLLIGEVREKQEARAEYNAAIARGETAALLEQDKPDVFKQKIGNIPPHSRVNIRITYVTDLKVEADGSIRFFLPTAVAPRYTLERACRSPTFPSSGRGTAASAGASGTATTSVWRYKPYDELPFYGYRWVPEPSWRGRSRARSRSRSRSRPPPTSTSPRVPHARRQVGVPRPANKKQATASLWYDTAPLGKDFVLRVHQHAAHEPRVTVEVAPDGSAAAMLTLVPDFDIEPVPTELQFRDRLLRLDVGRAHQRPRRARCASSCSRCRSRATSTSSSLARATPRSLASGPRAYTEETLRRRDAPLRLARRQPRRHRAAAAARDDLWPQGQQRQESPGLHSHRRPGEQHRAGDRVLPPERAQLARLHGRHRQRRVARARRGHGARRRRHRRVHVSAPSSRARRPRSSSRSSTSSRSRRMPAISKVMVDWGVLGALAPPSYDAVLAVPRAAHRRRLAHRGRQRRRRRPPPRRPPPPARTRWRRLPSAAATRSSARACASSARCPSSASGTRARRSSSSRTRARSRVWNGSASLPEGVKFEFKFIKKRDDGYVQFEALAANRTALAHGQEATLECGTFGAARDTKPSTSPPSGPWRRAGAPPPAAAAAAAPPSRSVDAGAGEPRRPVGELAGPHARRSRRAAGEPLLQDRAGVAARQPRRASSPHGVGSGTAGGALLQRRTSRARSRRRSATATTRRRSRRTAATRPSTRRRSCRRRSSRAPSSCSSRSSRRATCRRATSTVTAEAPDGPMTLEHSGHQAHDGRAHRARAGGAHADPRPRAGHVAPPLPLHVGAGGAARAAPRACGASSSARWAAPARTRRRPGRSSRSRRRSAP
jgi:hypothetical protein